MNQWELIFRTYYMIFTELGEPFVYSDLVDIINCDMTLEEFNKWLIEQEDEDNFEKWLEENSFDVLWHS